VQIRKPEDEKYFKDITLNHIFKEIVHETENLQSSQTTVQKKQTDYLKTFFYLLFFGILPIVLLFLFFSPIKETVEKTHKTKKRDTTVTKNIDTTTNNIIRGKTATTSYTKTLHSQNRPKQHTVTVNKLPKNTKPDSKSIRQKAKQELLKQMKMNIQ